MTGFANVCVLAGALLLAGCAAAGGPETVTILRLQSPDSAAAGQKLQRSILVAPVQARGLTADRRYVYIDEAAPAELRQASTLFWEEPPSRSLERALVGALRGRYASVSGSDMTLTTDERVVARLERFEEETGASHPARALVAFDITTVENADRRIGFSGRYCASAAIDGTAPSARADAFSRAMTQAAEAFAHDLAAGVVSPSAC